MKKKTNLARSLVAIKRNILSVLAFALMLTVIPFETVEAASSINKRAGKAYAEIIERYMQAFETVKNDPKAVEYETGSNAYYALYNGKKMDDFVSFWFIDEVRLKYFNETYTAQLRSRSLAYKITDFNKDGVPELFIGLGSSNGVRIFDLYTFKKGKAVRLKKDLNCRNAWYSLCKNNIIEEYFSSGAFTGEAIFHKISKNGKLTNFIVLSWTQDTDYYTKARNGRTSIISEAEYERIYQKYSKPIKMTFYKADDKAVKSVKSGKFFYKNQKKFSDTNQT